MPFLRQIVESSPAALQRWQIIRNFVHAYSVFSRAAKRGRQQRLDSEGKQDSGRSGVPSPGRVPTLE
jgi:hypothetical protein